MSQDLSQDVDKNLLRDFAYVIRLTCLTILLTLGMEWRSFLPGFRHPFLTPVPLYEPLATLPYFIDWGIFILCMMLLVWLFITPTNRFAAFGISACIVFWGVQDIVRFQPWFHMYCFVTLVAAFCKRTENGLNALRIMICGVYFWAGFHKLNMTFFTQIMPWFFAPIYIPSFDWLFKIAGYITPIFEAAIGIMLLFPQWRRAATAMAFIMLMVVLICLGPYGHNWGKVIPLWNIWLFLMEVRLFLIPAYNENRPLLRFKLQQVSMLISVIMFVAAPALAIFVPGYARLGFKIFAGNTLTAEILIAPEEMLTRHSKLFKGMVKQDDRLSFKIPIYHSEYAYRKRAKAIYPYLDYPAQATLRIYSPPPFYSTQRAYTDMEL